MPADRADRRAFLKKAGLVGAGVAGATWVAPSVLALDRAFAVGSCCAQNSLNLLATPFGNGVNTAVGSFTALGTTLTFTRNGTDTITNTTCTGGGSWTTGVITNCEQGGNSTGQIAMCAVGTDKTPIVIKMSFSTPVRNLTFVLTDIDASNLSSVEYQEQVSIAWTNTTGTSIPVYTPGSNIVNVSPNVYKANSATYNAPQTDTTNNLGVDFGCGGKVSSVTVTSSNLNGTAGTSNNQGRYIGISQIKYCI